MPYLLRSKATNDMIETVTKKMTLAKNLANDKKFTILSRDFTIDDGELTPTLKIRRKQINQNWSSDIESMYTE